MAYDLIQPPRVPLAFPEMTRQELREYRDWFHRSIPERIEMLAAAVRETPGYEAWEPDYSPDSLDLLGEWFAAQVETRPRTSEEMEQLRAQLLAGYDPTDIKTSLLLELEPEDWTLTNRTVSLCMDIGMYLSQVFLREHLDLTWSLVLRSKRSLDYGQPVLAGFCGGKLRFNPYGAMMGLAEGLVRGADTSIPLRACYDSWSDMVAPTPEALEQWAPEYQLIQPPHGLLFGTMRRQQLLEHNAWFGEVPSARVEILAEAVRRTPGYEEWKADGSPESLVPLGEWFLEHLDLRPRTPRELKHLQGTLAVGVYHDSRDPTGRVASLSLDVGMYLSQVLLQHHPGLQWDQRLRPPRLGDYGQPVLVGFANQQRFNPFYTLLALAYGLPWEGLSGRSLLRVYEHWAKQLPLDPR